MRATRRSNRSGTVLPMLGVCLIGLFAFVALAIDLGVLAVSRTQSQNAADVAALVGTRTLNNKDGVSFNNLPAAVSMARSSATGNPHLSANFSNAQITKIEVGQYLYDTTSQTFRVGTWVDVTNGGGVAPASGSWTAMRVTLGVDQPTYFMRLLGVNSMASGARATAVYRPRDIAFTLDMTGSMAYSSTFNYNNASQNPDPLVPKFGHYVSVQAALVSTTNQANGTGEAIPRNNFTISTPGGPPIVRNFYFDPTNMADPLVPAFPLTTVGSNPNLLNAFHRWLVPQSGGNSDAYVAVTYDFSQYDPTHNGTEANPKGPIPAPDFYGTATDSGSVLYAGDRPRRGNGAIDKTETTWATGSAATRAAYHAADLLGYGTTPPTGITPAFTTDWLNFRDPVWEKYGYDLDIVKYRAWKTGSNAGRPGEPAAYETAQGGAANVQVPAADRFKGYSMGPGYWGKTFYMWPPDPRAPVGNPGDLNYQAGDWRRRYFFNKSGGALDPQGDNNTTNTAGTTDNINEVLFSTGTGQTLSLTVPTQVNYTAILKWIKSGPQVMPPNLRAGRVLYYSSIPDDVNTGTGGTQERLDKALWKAYIDFVLGVGSYTSAANMYGSADSWSASAQSITTSDLTTYKFSWQTLAETATRPYMRYTDSPRRPRLNLWFGPLSFMDFLGAVNGNWLPGTCYEAQCWQLKAGVSAVLSDVKNNHPNDFAGMVMFATNQHNGVRVGMNQDFTKLKNALFYPKSLLSAIDGGDITSEYRPYNTTLGGYDAAEIPNASGGTDPATGLAYAYNLLSSSQLSGATAVGTGGGRRGAQKIVIFETDGVPNSYRVPTFNARGYNSYYTLASGVTSGGNGDTTNITYTHNVIKQIVKPMSTTGTTSTGPDSGHSLPNAPARVYPIAFGDLFDTDLSPGATFRPTALQFMAQCAEFGGTGTAGATTLPSDQIITGPYQQRITRLRDTLERIFQGGVSVVLVE